MYQLFIFSAIVFSTYFVSTSGQATYPIPGPNATICMSKLKTLGVLDDCRTTQEDLWNPDNRKEKEGTSKDSCCQIYGEIDCIKKATNTPGICGSNINRQAFLKHQQNVANYWSTTFCKSIKYHGGSCTLSTLSTLSTWTLSNSGAHNLAQLSFGLLALSLIAMIFPNKS
jgi:hypothetical protein